MREVVILSGVRTAIGKFNGTLRDFIMGEIRYNMLTRSFPDEAKKLHKKLEEDVNDRYKKYKAMAEK